MKKLITLILIAIIIPISAQAGFFNWLNDLINYKAPVEQPVEQNLGATLLFPHSGGVGKDSSAWTGIVRTDSGVWSTTTISRTATTTINGLSSTDYLFQAGSDITIGTTSPNILTISSTAVGGATTTINSVDGPDFTFATSGGMTIATSTGTITFGYNESDPVWVSEKGDYLTSVIAGNTYTASNTISSTYLPISATGTFLTVETDPIWTAAIGDYYLSTYINTNYYSTSTIDGAGYLTAETDPIWQASSSDYSLSSDISSTYFTISGANASNTVWATDNDTTYTAGGTLLDLTGTVFSVLEGTLTTGKLCTYVSGTGIVCNSDDANTQLSQATVEDYAGGLWTGNTETLITVEYQTGDNTLDAIVNNDLSQYSNATSGFLTSYNETDPVWLSEKGDYLTSALAATTYLATGTAASTYQPIGSYATYGDASTTNYDSSYVHSLLTSGNPHSVTQTDIGLSAVENTAISTFAGTGNIVWLGTVGTGTWQGGVIANAYIADDITLTNITQITNRAITDLTGVLTYANGGTGTSTALALEHLWWGDGAGNLVQVASSTLAGTGGGTTYDPLWIQNGTDAYATDTVTQIGIGTTTPAYTLDVEGTLGVSGAITSESSVTATRFVPTLGGSNYVFQSSSNIEASNFLAHASAVSNTTNANALIGGADSVSRRISFGGDTSTLYADKSLASIIIKTNTYAEASSGVIPIASQLAIKPFVLNSGAGDTTNAVTLYIEGASTGTASPSNNYAFWVDDGKIRLDGDLQLGFQSGFLTVDASGDVSTSTIGVADLTSEDFGDFTCNGTACNLDATYLVGIAGGAHLTVTGTSTALDAEIYTRSFSFVISNPTTTEAVAIVQWSYPYAITISKIKGSSGSGTTTIQCDERAEATPNTAGTDIMSAALELGTTIASTTAFANAGIVADAWISCDIDAVVSATSTRISGEYTIDD